MDKKVALVIGATGVSGRALLSHLERQEDWDVVGVSRKKAYFDTRARFLSVDLMDETGCREGFRQAAAVTHVFCAAYADHPDVKQTRA
jgi:nucleoside-diphosphate-sugar epimerase